MNAREPFNHKQHRESQAPKVTRRQSAGERSCDYFHCCFCYWTLAVAGKEGFLPERGRAALKKNITGRKLGKKLLPSHNPGKN